MRDNDDLRADREIVAEMLGSQPSLDTVGSSRPDKRSQIQYSVKDRSQVCENDRFLVQKKVKVEALPETMRSAARVPDVKHMETKIITSAAEVHEAYLQRISEIR